MTNDPVLIAHGLTKLFSPGTTAEVRAVDGVDLTVGRGDIVLIMGPSGSGKTTLITLLGALARPTAGTVSLGGVELTGLTERQLPRFRRTHIGFVFQSFHLLSSLTALENVALMHRLTGATGAASRAKAAAALEQLGLGERLGSFARQLSGGEKQRVSIARALANNPTIVFADEPTANLDADTGRSVMRLLCGIACEQHKSVIIVSHDERLKDVAQRIIRMEDGRLVSEETGNHNQWCQMHRESAPHARSH